MIRTTVFFLVLVLFAACGDASSASEEPATAPANETAATEQADEAPMAEAAPKTVQDFVPAGHSILQQVEGDLNQDGIDDVALVLKSDREGSDESRTTCGTVLRPLLLLTRDAGGQLQLALRNDRAVLGEGCGGALGDPFDNLDVEGGRLTFTFMGGSREQWLTTRTFAYSASGENWELVKDETEVIDRTNPASKGQVVNNLKERPQLWLMSYNTYE